MRNIENMETKAKSLEPVQKIDGLVTPSLLLDRGKLERNINRLADHARRLGVVLRPHMKTAKSIDVARQVFPTGPGPITVSTIAEAEYFASHGYRDITYAVGLSPASARRASELCRRTGVDLKLLLDTVEQADALADVRKATGVTPSVFIELDCDDHRGGLKPDDPKLIEVANRVVAAGAHLVGVLAHAGESYGLSAPDALVKAAENERSATVRAAEILRARGHVCPIVSLGSTPTAHFAENLDGVTELRAGVYMFFDLVQHGVGVCAIDDIAVSVLASVIGAKPEKGWVLVDAGWMALSRDRGTANQQLDQGYGVVCDEKGRVLEDVVVAQASQEHGILAIRAGSGKTMPEFPVGTRIRILPNHACAMAAQHDFYSVINGESPQIEARWERIRGW
jgi:D-serine deaminase-like pyridoxal phosphate-dependent protein